MGYTSAERALAVLHGEIPDRVPIFEYLIHDGVFGRVGYPDIRAGDVDAYLKACSHCLDICHPVLNAPFAPGERQNADGSRTIVERWMKWEVPPPAAVLTEAETLRRLKAAVELLEEGGQPPDYGGLLAEKKRRGAFTGDMLYIAIGAGCALPYGNTESSIMLYADHPELVERRVALENRRTMERLQATAYPELSAVAIVWVDIAVKGRLFYSPDTLERLFYPALRGICDLLHSRGIKVIYHSDGDVSAALPALAECGIDGFNPLEITAGMDYTSFKKYYGKRIALVGGLDAVGILAHGSAGDVAAGARRLIDVAGAGGGLIAASASGQIDGSMPTENVMAYFETVWEYGKY